MVQPDLEEKIYRRELPVWLHEVETALLVTEVWHLLHEFTWNCYTC